ncbi:MAG: M56 family metallopeptidase, partial [Anaerolineae bacterium]
MNRKRTSWWPFALLGLAALAAALAAALLLRPPAPPHPGTPVPLPTVTPPARASPPSPRRPWRCAPP